MDEVRRPRVVVGALLALLAVQELAASRRLSAVFDEQAHIAAGYAYVVARDHRFNPEHPPLVKLMAGLAASTLPLPDLRGTPELRRADQWGLGARLLAERSLGRWELLDRARLPTMAIGILGGWLCYRLAATLHGRLAGAVALLLWAGWPEMVGHAPLVTTDVPVTTFSLGALLAARRLRRGFTLPRALALAIHVSLALLVKYSAAMLLPILFVVLLLPGRRVRAVELAAAGGITLLTAIVLGLATFQGLDLFRVYPGGFWLALTRGAANPDFPFYLMGAYSTEGFWSYYAVALLLKTPLPLLALLLGGLATVARRRPGRDEIGTVAIPALCWLGLATLLAADIALRYAMPAFPFLLAIAARPAGSRRPGIRLAVVLLALACVVATARTPDAVGYTNALVRPGHELRYLDMGNIDWGQGLRALAEILEEPGRSRAPVVLWYLSPLDASAVLPGFVRQVPGFGREVDPATGRLRPGRYAVSAQHLLRYPGARRLLADSCGVEAAAGPSLYLFCCPPCMDPPLPEDAVLRVPLAGPPERGRGSEAAYNGPRRGVPS